MVAIIFSGRLKRGNKGPFCSPNGFTSDFDNKRQEIAKGNRRQLKITGVRKFNAPTIRIL